MFVSSSLLIADGPANYVSSTVVLQHQVQPEEDHADSWRKTRVSVPQEEALRPEMPHDRHETQGNQAQSTRRARQIESEAQKGLQSLRR